MRFKEMVSAYMTDNPVTMTPERPVIQAYALMAQYEIRHIPVVEGGKLVGIVSDRDLHRAAPLGRAHEAGDVAPLFATPVSAIMTREDLLTIDPQASLEDAARILLDTKVSALPVVARGRLVGILTTHDLLGALVGLVQAA